MAKRRTDRLTALGVRFLRTRWLVRAPIGLYRAGLGAVLGSRSLMLEHTGRTSGRRRLVVLEVLERPAPGTWVVVSGFGARAQWSATLARYAHAHPRALDHLRLAIEAAVGGSIEERSSELPMMALEAVVEGVAGYSPSAM